MSPDMYYLAIGSCVPLSDTNDLYCLTRTERVAKEGTLASPSLAGGASLLGEGNHSELLLRVSHTQWTVKGATTHNPSFTQRWHKINISYAPPSPHPKGLPL